MSLARRAPSEPYAWLVGKTFATIPQVDRGDMWGEAAHEFRAELEQWITDLEAQHADRRG